MFVLQYIKTCRTVDTQMWIYRDTSVIQIIDQIDRSRLDFCILSPPKGSAKKGRAPTAVAATRRSGAERDLDDLDVTRVHVRQTRTTDARDKHARLAHVFFRAPSASARRGYVRATRNTTRHATRHTPSRARGIDDVGATEGFVDGSAGARRRVTRRDATRDGNECGKF